MKLLAIFFIFIFFVNFISANQILYKKNDSFYILDLDAKKNIIAKEIIINSNLLGVYDFELNQCRYPTENEKKSWRLGIE